MLAPRLVPVLLLAACNIPLDGSEDRVGTELRELADAASPERWADQPGRRVRALGDRARDLGGAELDRVPALAQDARDLDRIAGGDLGRIQRRTTELVAMQFRPIDWNLPQAAVGPNLHRAASRAPSRARALLAIDGQPLPEADDPIRQTELTVTPPRRGWSERILRRIGF